MNPAQKIYSLLMEAYGPQGWWPLVPHDEGACVYKQRHRLTNEQKFQVVLGAILTQNVAWVNVEKALVNLDQADLLSIRAVDTVQPEKLGTLIRPTGYYNQKVKKIQAFMSWFAHYRFSFSRLNNSATGKLRDELLGIKGIGPETADSILLYAMGRPAFVVDAYTRRITSRVGLVPEQASYDQVQEYFTGKLEPDVHVFNEYHALLVNHAKEYCMKTPSCASCPLEQMCRHGQTS